MPCHQTSDQSASFMIAAITVATRGTSGAYPMLILALGLFVAVAITADVHRGVVSAAVLEQAAHANRVRELAAKLTTTSSSLMRYWRSIFG